MIKKKKQELKKKKTVSMNADDQNGFMIREMPDPNNQSNYSSAQKNSTIRDVDHSDKLIDTNALLELSEFEKFQQCSKDLGANLKGFKECSEFEMVEDIIRQMIVETKNVLDERYHNFTITYKKCFSFSGNSPRIAEADKNFDWKRMKQDAGDLKSLADKYYKIAQSFAKKRLNLESFKSDFSSFKEDKFSGFELEKYRSNDLKPEMDDKQVNSIFESDLKEEKESPFKKDPGNDMEFDLEEEVDPFGKIEETKSKKGPSFALDQEKDAFAGFKTKDKVDIGQGL